MHFSILALFTILPSLALNTLASPTSTNHCLAECCSRALQLPASPGHDASPAQTTSQLTNAQRLARGLPIKPPRRRPNVVVRSAFPRASSAPRASYRGIIAVKNTANGQILGYISRNSSAHPQYHYKRSTADALVVSFSIDIDMSAVYYDVRILSENSDKPAFPLMSLVQGRDATSVNLGPGSFNYAYVAGMAEPGSPPDSVPVTSPANSYSAVTHLARAAMSNVWIFNKSTMGLRPQWVNSDGSKPRTTIFSQHSIFYISGDQDAFFAKYPDHLMAIELILIPL